MQSIKICMEDVIKLLRYIDQNKLSSFMVRFVLQVHFRTDLYLKSETFMSL